MAKVLSLGKLNIKVILNVHKAYVYRYHYHIHFFMKKIFGLTAWRGHKHLQFWCFLQYNNSSSNVICRVVLRIKICGTRAMGVVGEKGSRKSYFSSSAVFKWKHWRTEEQNSGIIYILANGFYMLPQCILFLWTCYPYYFKGILTQNLKEREQFPFLFPTINSEKCHGFGRIKSLK